MARKYAVQKVGNIPADETGNVPLEEGFVPLTGTAAENPMIGSIEFEFEDNTTLIISPEEGIVFPSIASVTSGGMSFTAGGEYRADSFSITDDVDDLKGDFIKGLYATKNFTEDAKSDTNAYVQFAYLKCGNLNLVADSVETVFLIPHGLSTIPSYINVRFRDGSNIEFRDSILTTDTTNIIITCPSAPTTSTVTDWEARP